jgi:nickel-type superoxide dismutase maturation protease
MVKNLVLRFSPYFKYKIVGSSMSPAIGDGQIIFVNRMAYLFYNPHKCDIIALHDPRDGKILIKRITKINRNKYFVAGDNKSASTDSRVFGWIEKKDIIGRVQKDT